MQANRPDWPVINQNVRQFDATPFYGQIDLLVGGVPCPPFSITGKQSGDLDERDLFPEAIRLVRECNPKSVMLEKVKKRPLIGRLETLFTRPLPEL